MKRYLIFWVAITLTMVFFTKKTMAQEEDVIAKVNADKSYTLQIRVWCLGKIENQIEGKTVVLHSMKLNKQHGSDGDIVAKAKVKNGWVKFNFPSPANKTKTESYHDRYWGTSGNSWLCIPLERNPFLRKDTADQPGIEIIWSETGGTPVPKDAPRDSAQYIGVTPKMIYTTKVQNIKGY